MTLEAESKEKRGVWDPMTLLIITSPSVDARVDSNTFTMGNPMPEPTLTCARIDFIPQSGTLDLALGYTVVKTELRHNRFSAYHLVVQYKKSIGWDKQDESDIQKSGST
jgi:hypothetical protein